MNVEALHLAEVEAWDAALGATRMLRFANRAFTTEPSESPANTPYEVDIQQPGDIERNLFAHATTRGRSTEALGDVVLLNPDGDLDFMNELAFDGRSITLRRSTVFNPSYPADFETSFAGTMEQVECTNDRVTIKLRDVFYSVVNTPLQTNKYLGDNVAPNGLEGTAADLKGKPKPVCLGVVKSIPAPPVNTPKLIYQVNDGAVHAIDNVYDRGVALQQGHQWNSTGVVGSGTFHNIWYGGGLWVRTSSSNGTVYTSPDRITWTLKYTVTGAGPTIVKAAYHAGEWLVSANHGAGPHFLHTTDNFTTVTTSAQPSGATATAVFYHEAGSLWIGTGGGNVYSSPDGLTWTLRYSTPSVGGNFADGAYRNGIGVLIGNDGVTGQGLAVSSTDGITWIERVTGATTAAGLLRVIAGPDRFVAIGSGGASIVSLDGLTWTRGVMPAIAATSQLVYAEALYLTFSTSVGLLVSPDGFEWGAYADGLGVSLRALASDGVNLVSSDTTLVIRYTTPTSYATVTDLLDDNQAPLPFHWKAYLAGGYVRLGGTPDGIVTIDATQGAASANRTAAALSTAVLSRVSTGPTFDAGDLTALDGDDNSELGYWTMDEGVTCDEVLDAIAGTPNAAWYPDKSAQFRIARFEAPSGTPALTITKDDIKRDTLQRIASNDQGNGIPIYQVVVQWGRFYQTITTDIAGAVSDAARAEFAQEWRNAIATDLSVLTAHPSAGILVIQSLYTNEADALAEAVRQLALRKVKRDPFEFTIELNDETDVLDLNDVIELVHPRYSLSVVGSPSGAIEGGGLFRILDVRPNAEAKELTLTVWGGARYKNLVAADGAYIISAVDGAYIISEIAA